MRAATGARGRAAALVLILAVMAGAIIAVARLSGTEHRIAPPRGHWSVVSTPLDAPLSHAMALDADALTGTDGNVLLAMPDMLGAYYGYGGFLDVGTSMVVATARPLPAPEGGSGTPVGTVTLTGMRPADAAPAWSTPIGTIDRCSPQTDQPMIACWERRRIVLVDAADGTLLAELGTDFDVATVQVDGDTVYASGTTDDGAPVLTAGTATDLTAHFRRTFEDAGADAHVHAVPRTGTALATRRGPGDPQYVTTVYDLGSGDERFTFEGDSLQPAGAGMFLGSVGGKSGTPGTQQLLSADGDTVRPIPIPAYPAQTYPVATASPPPMFLGDGAYDPWTGEELWRSPKLVKDSSAGRASALAAVVGDIVVVTSPEARTLTGLDIRSGDVLWETPWEDAYWVRGGVTDGDHFVFSDYRGIHSLRVADGAIVWSRPLPEGADPRAVRVAGAGGGVAVSWSGTVEILG